MAPWASSTPASPMAMPLPIALEAYHILVSRQINGTALEANTVGVSGNKVDLGICVVSAVGAITIIFPFLWNTAQRKLRHALIVGLATSDLVSSAVIIASTSYLLRGGDLTANHKFCNFLGFSLATTIWTQHLWNLSIAIVTYMLLVHPLVNTVACHSQGGIYSHFTSWSYHPQSTFTLTVERRLPYLWPLFWALAAIVNGIAWRFVGFSNVGGYCLFSPTSNNLFSPLFQFIPRGIVVIVIVVLYAKLFVFLRRTNLFNRSESQTASHGSTRPGHISGLDDHIDAHAFGACRCSCSSQGKQPLNASISASRRSSPATKHEDGALVDIPEPPTSRRSSRLGRLWRASLSQQRTSNSFVSNVFGHRFCECPCHFDKRSRVPSAAHHSRSVPTSPAPVFSQPFVGEKTTPRRPRTADTTGPLGERVEMTEIVGQDQPSAVSEWGGVSSKGGRWRRDGADDNATVGGSEGPHSHDAASSVSAAHARNTSASMLILKKQTTSRGGSRRPGSEASAPPTPVTPGPSEKVWKRGHVEWYDIKPEWDQDTDSAASIDSHGDGVDLDVERADEAMFMPSSPTQAQPTSPLAPTSLTAASAAVAAVASSPRRDPLATYRAAQMEARRDVVDFNMSSAPREHLNHFTVHAVYASPNSPLPAEDRANGLLPSPRSPSYSQRSSRRPSANGSGSDAQGLLAVLPLDPAAPGPEWEPDHDFEGGLGDKFSWGANIGEDPSGSGTACGTATSGKRSGSASADGLAQMTGERSVPQGGLGPDCNCPVDQEGGGVSRANAHVCASNGGQTSTWTSDRHGVESLGSTLNRQASILMLLYPLAYTLLFSVSIIRILDDLANRHRVTAVQNRLHSVARWFILAQGALDAIIFLVIERHFRRRLKRRRKRALGEEVDESHWVLAWRWISTGVKAGFSRTRPATT